MNHCGDHSERASMALMYRAITVLLGLLAAGSMLAMLVIVQYDTLLAVWTAAVVVSLILLLNVILAWREKHPL